MLIIQLCTLYANFLYATQTDLCALISLKLLGKKYMGKKQKILKSEK